MNNTVEIAMIKEYNYYYFFACLFFLSALCFFLFFNQAFPLNGYASDLPGHLAHLWDGYSLINLFILEIQNLLKISRANISMLPIMIYVILLSSSVFFIAIEINIYLKFKYKNINPYIADFFSISLILVSMLIYSFRQWTLYLGNFSSGIWHNSTTIYCKLFSIPVFILLWFVYSQYKNNKLRYDCIFLISLFSFLSDFVKPSFMISFLPSVACVTFYLLIRKKISFYFFLIILISLSSSLIPLWLINQKIYEKAGATIFVIISPGTVWHQYTRSILGSLLLSTAFPFFVFIITAIKNKINFLFSVAWVNYVIALIIFYVFAESGSRMFDGNFEWSGQMAIFFLFLTSVEEFYFNKNNYAKTIKYAGSFLFVWHLVSGLYYFGKILLGYYYA